MFFLDLYFSRSNSLNFTLCICSKTAADSETSYLACEQLRNIRSSNFNQTADMLEIYFQAYGLGICCFAVTRKRLVLEPYIFYTHHRRQCSIYCKISTRLLIDLLDLHFKVKLSEVYCFLCIFVQLDCLKSVEPNISTFLSKMKPLCSSAIR